MKKQLIAAVALGAAVFPLSWSSSAVAAESSPVQLVGPIHTNDVMRVRVTCPAEDTFAVVAVTVTQGDQRTAVEANHVYGDCTGRPQVVLVRLARDYDSYPYPQTPPRLHRGTADVDVFGWAGPGEFGTGEPSVDISNDFTNVRVV